MKSMECVNSLNNSKWSKLNFKGEKNGEPEKWWYEGHQQN